MQVGNTSLLLCKEVGEEAGTINGVVSALTMDASGQYQFRADTEHGSVTYRVVQVTQSEDGQTRVVSGLQSGENILQDIANGADCASPTGGNHAIGQARLAFAPPSSGRLDSGLTLDAGSVPTNILNTAGGQFYLMVAPPDGAGVSAGLHTVQRQLAPRLSDLKADSVLRVSRDDRRRATHNEVERRRRDKINSWIMQLGKLVPDCAAEQSKQGDSKGGILSKTCEYIVEMQTANAQMAETLKEVERLAADSDQLRRQYEELVRQNSLLRAELRKNGIEPPPELVGD